MFHYVHLEHIPEDPAAWQVKVRGALALADSLQQHREAAMLYRRLATLRTDVPIAESLEDLRVAGPSDDLAELCREIGYERFLDRFQ